MQALVGRVDMGKLMPLHVIVIDKIHIRMTIQKESQQLKEGVQGIHC